VTAIDTLSFDPDAVRITRHAEARYNGRRATDPLAVHRGIMRLLTKASGRPVPPLRYRADGSCGRAVVLSGFVLVFDAEMSTLITLYRAGR
jgi:hypothetical protein